MKKEQSISVRELYIGIGSNSWFGGVIKTIYHGDQVFKNPEIFLDGKRIIL